MPKLFGVFFMICLHFAVPLLHAARAGFKTTVGSMAEPEWFRTGEIGVLHGECDVLKNDPIDREIDLTSHFLIKNLAGEWCAFGSMTQA